MSKKSEKDVNELTDAIDAKEVLKIRKNSDNSRRKTYENSLSSKWYYYNILNAGL